MSEKTVLVIDDSSTIRRLCDRELSTAGYQVIVAPTAEEGIEKASSERPDLIILDHQLPGKTGYEVACELLKDAETAKIPVVASSTLRKKAYVEYVDCDNVVDMLPKPYTPEALVATVENAIDTGVMVVESQAGGTAVPEVIDEMGESDMTGNFACFSLREIIDMINNGNKKGVLTVENETCRVSIHVERGRIQAVTANGIDPQFVVDKMPESLSELAPVVKLTVGGRHGAEVDGLLGLMNNKMLDPRLLRKLLRLQAAILLRLCFTKPVTQFRFDRDVAAPELFQKLPLESSLLAILVESALICDVEELPECGTDEGYQRKAIRGQNLDRAGLSGRHMKFMNVVAEPTGVNELSATLQWHEEEVRRVAHGFEMAELIEKVSLQEKTKVLGVVGNSDQALKVRSFYQQSNAEVNGKLVRDSGGLRLLLRRARPDVLLLEMGEESQQVLEEFAELLNDVRVIGIRDDDSGSNETNEKIATILGENCTIEMIREAVLENNSMTMATAEGAGDE